MINPNAKKVMKILLMHLLLITCMIGLILITDGLCIIRKVINFPCPGCGLTRAWLSFFNGDILSAINYNPCFITFPFILMLAIHRQTRLLKLVDVKVIDAVIVLNAVVMFSSYVTRIATGTIYLI